MPRWFGEIVREIRAHPLGGQAVALAQSVQLGKGEELDVLPAFAQRRESNHEGLEAKKQLALAGEKQPDIVIGCAGGGSNFAGISFPFVCDKIHGAKIKIIPVEPTACPTLTGLDVLKNFLEKNQIP